MKFRKFAFATVLSLSAFATEAAQTAWTITTTGTIQSGFDSSGVFGFVGDLTGLTFTQSITASVWQGWSDHVDSSDHSITMYSGSGGAFIDTVTVNGTTVTFTSALTTKGVQRIEKFYESLDTGENFRESITTEQRSTTLFASNIIGANISFLPKKDFFLTINDLDISALEFQKSAQFEVFADGLSAKFYGVPDTFSMSPADRPVVSAPYPVPPPVPVPEPETYAMLVAGLGLVGAIARRRKFA